MSPKVLIVDDDRFLRRLIETTLEDVADFELIQAGDGAEAVELAARTHPRIVFLDVDMPRMDGLAACRALRAREDLRPLHIVMLTATPQHEQEARAAGADTFLTKPFSPLDLLRLVDELAAEPTRP